MLKGLDTDADLVPPVCEEEEDLQEDPGSEEQAGLDMNAFSDDGQVQTSENDAGSEITTLDD